jgi:hypothetical protein
VSREEIHGPSFFAEATVTGDSFLDTEFPPIFTGMYDYLSVMFFHRAGSDVLLKMEITTFSLDHPFR